MNGRPAAHALADLGAATRARPVALGRYDIVGRLGAGGMGTVYAAIDRERGTRVALKTLSVQDAAAGVSLKREFRVVADLGHENLAPVYELGSEGDVWFFTMEHVDGVSLATWARPSGAQAAPAEATEADLPLSRTLACAPDDLVTFRSAGADPASRVAVIPPRAEATRRSAGSEVATRDLLTDPPEPRTATPSPLARDADAVRRVFGEIVAGVAALHQAGLRHGDIKPANVLVRDDGRVVLVDFGLVRSTRERGDDRTPSGGTPVYMAPEQLGRGAIGVEADWYAVGATLYRVLTGVLPWTAGSLVELYGKKMRQPPLPPHAVVPSTPLDLSDACMLLMHPDPTRRPDHEALLRMFGASPAAPEVPSERPRETVFVGREAELYALERAYGAARAGTPILVHVHGASGIGKSSLLASFLGAVREVDSAVVLRGRCYERESVPYKGFDRIVDDLSERLRLMADDQLDGLLPTWTGELGRAFPALAAVPAIAARAADVHVAHDAIELRRRAWIALGELFAGLRRSGPVVLAIDDVQWIDEDSAQLLASLLRGAQASPGPAPTSLAAPSHAAPSAVSSSAMAARSSLLVILLYRPAEAAASQTLFGHFALARQLEGEGRLVEVLLAPLTASEAEALAAAALSDAGAPHSETRARVLAEEAQGVPFFIQELAHFAGRRTASERREPGDPDGRVSLDDAIRARVGQLPPDQRAIVEVVAIAGSPIPQRAAFEAASLEESALPALLALRRASLVSWLGAGGDDAIATYHDRIREAVAATLAEPARLALHLAVGRALAKRHHDAPGLVFDAIRHLAAAASLISDDTERMEVARLHAEAGERARNVAAFPLAFQCFEAGIALLPHDAWKLDYALTLRLHAGATDAAYLTASWDVLDGRIADVKAHARTVLDAMVAWQAQIDAHVGRHEYIAALDVALEVLDRLGVHLPRDPSGEQVGGAVQSTLARLTELGLDGLLRKPDLADPIMAAATELQVRVSPAAYFGKPVLLPVIACNLIATSIDRGVSAATPYALALFGIVLNTLDLHPVAHDWGRLALGLLERWPERKLEAATRHILFNLVCCWTVPLATILEPLRQVFDIGCRTGDYEYASYAAHGYVHNAMYAGRPLGPLLVEARKLGAEMRALGQVNALHVHAPFEQLLAVLTGDREAKATLDGPDFDEQDVLRAAEAEGSRSGIFVVSVVMGMVRWYVGRATDASACFERARGYLDAAPSVWHVPMLHQLAALSACSARDEATEAEQPTLRARAEESLAALRKLAGVGPANFAHRVSMVEAELARIDGEAVRARELFDQAIRHANESGWINDVAMANELCARCEETAEGRKRRLRAARMAYSAWGATALADRVAQG